MIEMEAKIPKEVTKDFVPKRGDIFYSDFFKKRGAVTVYNGPNNWYFVLDGIPKEMKAHCRPQKLKWFPRED